MNRDILLDIQAIKLLYDKVIDFLVFPQDDSSLYGLISLDQQKVSTAIKSMNLENQILIYQVRIYQILSNQIQKEIRNGLEWTRLTHTEKS